MEVLMLRKLFTFTTLGVISAGALLATGCSSGNSKPYGLAGNSSTVSTEEQTRWTDSKGHYRPEWRNGINTPPGYPH
jgi:hypothetical protein